MLCDKEFTHMCLLVREVLASFLNKCGISVNFKLRNWLSDFYNKADIL